MYEQSSETKSPRKGKDSRTCSVCPLYLLLMLFIFVSASDDGNGVRNTLLLCEEQKLIIFLQQDGKTAEDLTKSEQHEHVAGLLARLKSEKFCLLV